MYSLVEENYLKAILNLSLLQEEVNVNELSKKLGIKMPSVTNMMKKFSKKGLVHYEQYKPLKLTDKGKIDAALIIRKHRLVEMYLVEKLHFGWDEVHSIAEQIEHVKSDLFFDKIEEALCYPTIDPHGSPIPDKYGKIKLMNHKKLSDCQINDEVQLMAVNDSTEEFLKYLTNKGITLGTQMKIISIESFDHSLQVTYNEQNKETLSKSISDKLLVG